MSVLARVTPRLCWALTRVGFWLYLLLQTHRLQDGMPTVWLGQLIVAAMTAGLALMFADAVRDADNLLTGREK